MNRSTTDRIDQAAVDFYRTKDRKHFEIFAKAATPIIKAHVTRSCAGSVKWDPDVLFSILLSDMWRLFQVYTPDETKKFHWLMHRQLKNKTINYIQNTTERVSHRCFVCNTTQTAAGNTCTECGASLKKPHAAVGVENYDLCHNYSPDYLQDTATRQVVNRLLQVTSQKDTKTYKILQMLLDGYTKLEISEEMGIAQNALNHRLRKCAKLIKTWENIHEYKIRYGYKTCNI